MWIWHYAAKLHIFEEHIIANTRHWSCLLQRLTFPKTFACILHSTSTQLVHSHRKDHPLSQPPECYRNPNVLSINTPKAMKIVVSDRILQLNGISQRPANSTALQENLNISCDCKITFKGLCLVKYHFVTKVSL